MFSIKKKRAILNLRRQKEKLNEPKSIDDSWQSQTADYFKSYFGESSHIYEQIKPGGSYSSLESGNYPMSRDFLKRIEKFKKEIDDAIEFLESHGLYKPEKKNFLSRLSDDWLVVIFTVLLPSLFGLGIWFNSLVTDIQIKKESTYKEKQKEIDSLKMTISIISNDSSNVTKEQSNKINQ